MEDKKGSKKEIKVTIDTEEMKKYLQEAADKLSEEMNIKGFRPGKAPLEVVRNSVGEEKFWNEATKVAVEKTYPKILEEKDIFAISQPEITFSQSAPGNDLIYKASFFVMPDINLPDYKKIAKEVVEDKGGQVEVSDGEVDDTLEKIRESRATLKKVEREAEEGDQVEISFTGSVDGEKRVEEENMKLILGRENYSLLKDFEDEITGMKPGEKVEFEIDLPEGKNREEEEEKKMKIELKVETVSERSLPELTDEFAASLHESVTDLKELQEKVGEGIESEKKAERREKLKMEIVQKLIENTDLEVPEVLVGKELENMKMQMERRLQQNATTFEDYLDQIGKTEEELKEEWRDKASDNVAAAIILHKLAEEEKIEVSDREIEEEVERHFKMSGRKKEEENDENLHRLRSYIHDMKKNEKIFDFLID